MNYVQLQNYDGVYVIPTEDSFRAAAANTQWDKALGFYEILTNKSGQNSWPITGATFILMHKSQANPAQALEVLKFFAWTYTHGDEMALELDYIPMPDNIVELIEDSWKANIKGKGGQVIYSVRHR